MKKELSPEEKFIREKEYEVKNLFKDWHIEKLASVLKEYAAKAVEENIINSITSQDKILREAYLHYKTLNKDLSKQEIAEHSFITGINYWHYKLTGNELEY